LQYRAARIELGVQRKLDDLIAARAGFVADWPERVVKIRKLLAKVRR